jgi:arylsulfatase
MRERIIQIGAVFALAVAGCAPHAGEDGADKEPQDYEGAYNVIVVVLDSLRADHLGCYGYHRDTSPFIDTVAAQAVVFENASSNSTFTCESVASLFTGLLPSTGCTGLGWFAVPNPAVDGLATLYRDAGYRTGFFTDHPALADPLFRKGFHEQGDIHTEQWGLSGSGGMVSQRALQFAKAHANQPFLMYLHYLDPHSPYQPPDEEYLQFADTVYPNPLRLHEDVRPNLPELLAEGFGPGEERFEDMVIRYDAEIRVVDAAVRDLMEGLDALGVADRTLVVITADHGEEFLDHGYVEHAWRLYRESTHVPLILWAPELLEPARFSEHVSLVQLLPTLLELTQTPTTRDDFDGESLFSLASGAPSYTPPQRPIFAELLMETRSQMRSVTVGDYRYFAAQRWLTPVECSEAAKVQTEMINKYRTGELPPLDVWQPIVHEELYNIARDPMERHNIAQDEPDTIARMREVFQEFRAKADRQCPQGPIRPKPTPER